MSAVEILPETELQTETYRGEPGDHEKFAHIIYAPGRKADAVVTEARVMGIPVKALCGKTWIPSRDPQRFPVCPDCEKSAEILRGLR